jgi:hypothetical protein
VMRVDVFVRTAFAAEEKQKVEIPLTIPTFEALPGHLRAVTDASMRS